MAIKPRKDTYTVKTSGNKTTKTWEYDDGTGSSVTTTNPSKNLDSKFGRKTPAPAKKTPTPTPKAKVAPMPTMSAQKKQEKALADLMKKRAAESKKTGSWPNYYTD